MIESFESYVESEDALFHYTKTSIALEKILLDKKFKLSIFNETSDPMEYKDYIFNVGWHFINDDDDLEDINNPNNKISEAQGEINSILKHKMRVMCLCSNRNYDKRKKLPPNGWKKSRMWSQYSDRHYGICLVLSKNKLENYIKKLIQNNQYRFGFINYTEKESINNNAIAIEYTKAHEMDLKSYCEYHIFKYIKDFFFRKHIDYRDESEYRVVIYDKNGDYNYIDVSEFLIGIIIGDRTSEVYFPSIKELCDNLNIECRRLYYYEGQMHLLQLPQK